MRTISVSELKEKALEAYYDGRLTAQAPDSFDKQCQYTHLCFDGVVRVCAIGAVLTSTELSIAKGPVRSLYHSHVVGFQNLKFAAALQRAHDNLCHLSKIGNNDMLKAEQDFLRLLKGKDDENIDQRRPYQ